MSSEARLKRLGLDHVPPEQLLEALLKQSEELERKERERLNALQAGDGGKARDTSVQSVGRAMAPAAWHAAIRPLTAKPRPIPVFLKKRNP